MLVNDRTYFFYTHLTLLPIKEIKLKYRKVSPLLSFKPLVLLLSLAKSETTENTLLLFWDGGTQNVKLNICTHLLFLNVESQETKCELSWCNLKICKSIYK